MATSKRCLPIINDKTFFKSVMAMKLCHVKQIERRFSSKKCPLHPHLKDLTVDVQTASSTTPLILACQFGELDSVKRIVESWGVDVRTPAAYYSDPSKSQSLIEIKKASPLFVASFYRCDNIVRYLLEKGADVSARTSNENGFYYFDGLTPLYGAVSYHSIFNSKKSVLKEEEERKVVVRSLLEFGADLIADSVRPNGRPLWMETKCGIETILVLIHHGLDLKQRDPITGETILHMVALSHNFTTEDSLVLVKVLVDKGADLMALDNQGCTPLLAVANANCPNWTILDYLLEIRDDYNRTCSRNSSFLKTYQLSHPAGADILLKIPCPRNSHLKGFQYWRRAHQLREMEKEVSGSSGEKVLGRKIGRNVEWTTLAELNELEKNPEEYKIQSLMVKLRIFFRRCHQFARFISFEYLDYLSDSMSLDNYEEFNQILGIRWEMFDQLLLHSDSNVCGWTVSGDVEKLVSTLSTLERKCLKLFNFETLKTSLDLILPAMNHSFESKKHYFPEILMYYFNIQFSQSLIFLLGMIFHLPETENKKNMGLLAVSLRQLGPFRLGYLLRAVLFKDFKGLSDSESLDLVRVLLNAGADPNVYVSEDFGNACLHIVATLKDRDLSDVTGLLLVEFGAKLHQVNGTGRTALDIWIELNETADKWNEEAGGWSARPEWCCPLPTLLRLAARVIRVQKLPYADGKTPVTLHPLIELR